MEVNTKPSKKDRFLKWWKIEGKLECIAAVIALIVMIAFWDNSLVQGTVMVIAAIWGYGKIFFKKEQWAFLLVISTYVLAQGISTLLTYMRA